MVGGESVRIHITSTIPRRNTAWERCARYGRVPGTNLHNMHKAHTATVTDQCVKRQHIAPTRSSISRQFLACFGSTTFNFNKISTISIVSLFNMLRILVVFFVSFGHSKSFGLLKQTKRDLQSGVLYLDLWISYEVFYSVSGAASATRALVPPPSPSKFL